MSLETIFEELREINGQQVKIKLYYDLGGMNYFTSKVEKRGYYLSVKPVTVNKDEQGNVISTTYSAFTGVKELLLEVKRKSNSAKKQAIAMLTEEKINNLLDHIGIAA